MSECENRSECECDRNVKFLDELKGLVIEYAKDGDAFYSKGNKAAGTRARKHLSNLAKLCKEVRADIQDTKKTD